MITGINRLQRPGRSYLHGILRDGARPYAYRSGARRLLHGGAGSGLRPLYGNHFMPVFFRYLDAPYGLEYGPSDVAGFAAAASVPGPVPVPRAVPARVAAPAAAESSAIPAAAATAAGPALRMPAAQPPAPPTAAGAQPAPAIDIMIPGGGVHKTAVRTEARTAAPTARQDLGDPHRSTPSLKQAPEPALEPATEPRAKPEAQPAVPAAPLPQRLPAHLSLKGLAEMLERQNFEKPAPARDEARISNIRHRSELPAAGMEPPPGEVPGARTAMQAPLPKKRIASVTPAVLATPAASPRMTTAAGVCARQPELRLPMPRRADPAPRRPVQRQAAQRPDREPQRRAGIARAPQRKQARSPRRINVIRRTAPAAFWERSYLSTSLELRLYR